MTPQSGRETRSRRGIRLLISGVAAGTTVLAGAPAALAFGRRIIVYLPAAEPRAPARPHWAHASPLSAHTLRTARKPAARPSRVQPPHPSPSPDRRAHDHETEGNGPHD